jgi:NitT/TauT family transport system substrate-binding protein
VPADRISRRSFARTLAVAASAVALPALPAEPRLEKIRLAMSVSVRAELQQLPVTLADQLGYFRAEGLEVEFVEGGAGTDIVAGTFDQVLALQARGLSQMAFVLQARTPGLALGVSTRWLPRFNSLADLKGRRVGIASTGATGQLMASLALARAGLGPQDVSFVNVGPAPLAPQALRTGTVEAICGPDPAITMLEQRTEVRIVTDTRSLKGTQDLFGGPMPAACIHASQEFLQKNPATCQAVANAVVHALKWLQTAGPRDLLRAVPESYLLGDRALYLAAFERARESISTDGRMPPEGARTALRVLSDFDALVRSGSILPARTYTNQFADRAKERFRA